MTDVHPILIDGYKAAGPDFLALQIAPIFATTGALKAEGLTEVARDMVLMDIQAIVGDKMPRLLKDIARLILASIDREG